MHNFDKIIDRYGSHSQKWDTMEASYGKAPPDAIPMWVADMDFRPPTEVLEALQRDIELGVLGYFGNGDPMREAATDWFDRRQSWRTDPASIHVTLGVVGGLGVAIRAFSETGDRVIVFSPVYHAFYRIIKANGREVLESTLENQNGRFTMNLDALENQLNGRERLLFISSPHNPGGTVWMSEELRELAEFCERHDIVLISDEIHADLTYEKGAFVPIASVAPDLMHRIAISTAASKTFNMAGMESGLMILPDKALRARFDAAHMATGKATNRFGMLMTEAAFKHGDAWLDELVPYIETNARLIETALSEIPGVEVMPLQSTYLTWADFAKTGLSMDEVNDRVQGKARIIASPGKAFGSGGETCLRFNVGTPRSRVIEAADRLREAFSDLVG